MQTNERRRGWGTEVALASALLAGCYRGGTPPQLCEGEACGLTTGDGSSSGNGSSSGGVPTTSGASASGTTAEPTTGAPVDTSVTFRLDSIAFIDPHLFYSSAADPPLCINDVTDFVNVALADDAMNGQFNLLARFEDFGVGNEMRLVDADCEDPVAPGERRVCAANPDAQVVLLTYQRLDALGCSELDPANYQPISLPEIHAPQAPCLRTNRVDFSVPISSSVGALSLRQAQFASRLDDPIDPQRLEDGLLFGFLTKAAAEDLNFNDAMFGVVNLWAMIDSPACTPDHPDYLPSVDSIEINKVPVPGVWLAINFTAERVDFVTP
jgi:hypothetical protein